MSDNEEQHSIEVSIGEAELKVASTDSAYVDDKFDDILDRLEENGHLESTETFHMQAGAGWLMAHADGETPDEAKEAWREMWNQMLSDVEELSAQEREMAGLAR